MAGLIDHPHSPHHQRQHHAQPRNRSADGHAGRRRMLVWVIVALLFAAAVPALFYAHAQGSARASERPSRITLESDPGKPLEPADQFMQSIVTEDGALGWHQLCPSLQAQIPLDTLVQQASAQRKALAQQGVWLTMAFVGTQPQPDGGVSHVYVVTAHGPGGATQKRTFTVLTQPSGCVEDVQTS
ncbi:MAG: hypothetical protein ACLQUY_04755 [Ktedonobacterales bacterium]